MRKQTREDNTFHAAFIRADGEVEFKYINLRSVRNETMDLANMLLFGEIKSFFVTVTKRS